MKVAILDMQPIDPPVGGGRLRLLGLYHDLGADIEATYVGTYDWPGPGWRRHMLSDSLEEIDVPLTDEHFRAAAAARDGAGGKNVIDCVFHLQAHLSPDFVAQARETAASADVVVFSHPWIYPLVEEVLDPSRQLIVYDSHNVEGVLRTQLLDDGAGGTLVAREVVALEKRLCREADLIFACSQEDRERFARLYGAPMERIKLVPNGVFVGPIAVPDEAEKAAAKRRVGLPDKIAAIFIGSAYGPNIEAASFIAKELAPKLPEMTFVVAGGVGDALTSDAGAALPENVVVTRQIDEAAKLDYLKAADIAVNPMFSGSGTNIKMFDFMAAGLAAVTTPIGARGISTRQPSFLTCAKDTMWQALRGLARDARRRKKLGANARTDVERYYSWERISSQAGLLLRHHFEGKIRKGVRPFFSVIVPTFGRPKLLTRLVDLLSLQTDRDFEVVIVDQSETPWPGADLDFGLDLLYVRTPIRGAVTARNLGALLARGSVLAFIDDDCEPSAKWLDAARELLGDATFVGLEGRVASSRAEDPAWRAVTNEGSAGMAFITANLFVRSDAFNRLNGFDIAFEEPHFREDTDLGWRLQSLGNVPYAADAWVYHPPHRRSVTRESQAVRDTFFEKDALLLQKHRSRYNELFDLEHHWRNTRGFWPNFLRGADKYGVAIPSEMLERVP